MVSAEEYLAIEEAADYKSEYFDGEMFAMSGANLAHDTVVGNLLGGLLNQLKTQSVRVHTSAMRVAASVTTAYTYPDISIACQDARYIHRGTDTLLNPVVIIEVLSPSTERHDRGKKFQRYKEIASLKEYVLIAQDEVQVERFLRQEAGAEWLYSSFSSLDDSLVLLSVPATLKLRDVFDGVAFPEEKE